MYTLHFMHIRRAMKRGQHRSRIGHHINLASKTKKEAPSWVALGPKGLCRAG